MCPIEDSRGGVDGGALDVSIVSIAVWLAVRYMTPCVCMCCRKPIIVEFRACKIFITALVVSGAPRVARPTRPEPFLYFGFQYALIRKKRSKIFV